MGILHAIARALCGLVFRAFDQDAKDNGEFAKTKLAMPALVLGGEKSGGDFLGRDERVEGPLRAWITRMR